MSNRFANLAWIATMGLEIYNRWIEPKIKHKHEHNENLSFKVILLI